MGEASLLAHDSEAAPLLAELAELGSATLFEASGLACDLDSALRPVVPGVLVGPAFPVLTAPGDNLALHAALERVRPGEVLVVDGGGRARGYWGEVLAVAAQTVGVPGLVIDGGVRDTEALRAMGFVTFARHVAIAGTTKHWTGLLGEPMEVGGRPVRRGDMVVGDADGIVILPAEQVPAIVDRARDRVAKEREFFERIRAGASTMDLYGFRGG